MAYTSTVELVPVEHIVRGDNDREDFNPTGLLELADSIRANGLAQKPVYRKRADGMYEIVAGERRTRAMRDLLGWRHIPAEVSEDMDDRTASAIMLSENRGRRNLNPIEEARGYAKRLDSGMWDLKTLSVDAACSEELIKRRLKLLKLRAELQHLVKSGSLPLGHAEALADLDLNRQLLAFQVYRDRGLPLNAFQEVVNRYLADQQQDSLFDLTRLTLAVQDYPEGVEARSGKRARLSAPTSRTTGVQLPPVEIQGANENTGEIVERYLAALLREGHQEAAVAVGNLYAALVAHNYMSASPRAYLSREDSQRAGEIAHVTR